MGEAVSILILVVLFVTFPIVLYRQLKQYQAAEETLEKNLRKCEEEKFLSKLAFHEDIEEKNRQLEELQKEFDDYKATECHSVCNSKYDQLQSEKNALQEENAKLRLSLTREKEAFEDHLEIYQKLRKELEETKEKLKVVNEKANSLLQEKDNQLTEYERDYCVLNDCHKKLSEKLESVTKELDAVVKKHEITMKEIVKLTQELSKKNEIILAIGDLVEWR